MVWYCYEHGCHSIDDVCPECQEETAWPHEIRILKKLATILASSFPDTPKTNRSSGFVTHKLPVRDAKRINRLLSQLEEYGNYR